MEKRDLMLIGLFPALSLFAQEKPNVLLIMADDMGYECLGVNGSTYHTPILDNMADSAMLFKNCHSQPLSTPSRVQLMLSLIHI